MPSVSQGSERVVTSGATGQGTDPRVAGAAPSATVVLARERRDAVEVLLVKRHGRTAFGASHVFPGGLVGPQDRAVHVRCAGRSGREAAVCLGVAEGALDYYSAAIRELFEETGVLLARDEDARFPSPAGSRELVPADRRAIVAVQRARDRQLRRPIEVLHDRLRGSALKRLGDFHRQRLTAEQAVTDARKIAGL